MSSRTKKLLVAAGFLFGALFALPTSAQIVQQNIFHLNPASSTIVPNNASYTIPCAYISTPGCGSGGGSGGVINATSTATSTITNLNGMLSVPYNYATAGCFGSPTTTDLGGCINLGYSLLPSGGGQIDIPSIGVAPYTTPIVEGNQANAKPVMLYCSSGGGFYGGGTILYYTPNSGSALTVNNIGYSGGGYGITNCGFNGPAGIGNIGSSTIGSTIGVNLGGTGAQGTAGAFGFTMTGVHISGFGTCLYIGSNMSFMLFQDGAINKCGRDIDSPAVSGANGENMRIVNSTVADCNSPTGQSISAFCMDVQESGNVQWTLDGDSFDDAQIYSNQFGGTANIWNITDLHDEDPNTGQACYDRILTQPSAAGAQATVFNIKGGDMMEDITTGCPEFVSFGGKLVLDATTGDINNNVSVPDTVYANPLNNSTVLSWTGLSNQGFNTSNSANTGFTNVVGTTTGSAIDGLELGSSSPVYYATTSTFYCATCSSAGGGIASSTTYSAGNIPLVNGTGALTNSIISQSVPTTATSSIAYDASSAWTTAATVSSATSSITVGNGANRMLFVFTLTTGGTASTTSVTDGSQTMTLVTSTLADATRTLALYDLPNPASGASVVTVNLSASEAVVQMGDISYSGVLQSTALDAVVTSATSSNVTSVTSTLTTVANNDWMVNLTRFGNGSAGNVAGANTTVRIVSSNGNTSLADTNAPQAVGSKSMTVTNSNGTSGGYSIMAAFAPAPATTPGAITIAGNSPITLSPNITTMSYIPQLTGGINLPSPAQLAAPGGVTCGTTTGVTDGILCLNDIYAANTNASSVVVNASGIYSSTNTIQINTLNEHMTVQCQQDATVFNFTATTSVPFLSLNSGAAGNGGSQLHPPTYGFFGCELRGPGNTTVATNTIGLQFGGSNGSEGATFAYGKIDGFGTNVTYASSSWRSSLLYDDISSGYVLWNFPSGLSNTGESITADHVNFHDSTQTVGTSTYVNCVTVKGGGYIDFEFDNFDDCQFKNTGTGAVRMVDYYGENPGGDGNLANYVPVVNAPAALSDLLDMTNPFFTEDGTTASGTPVAFITNGTGTIFVSDFGVLKNGAGTVASFFTNSGPGNYSICNGVGQNTPWTHFNGTDDSQIATNGSTQLLIGCSQAASGNWPTGWVSLGLNLFGVTDGGILQQEVSPSGIGFATSSVSVTNATVVGSDNSGVFTTTGGTTAFTLSFTTAFASKPVCVAQIQSATATTTVFVASPATTSTLFTSSASVPSGTKVQWICNGDPN